MNLTALRTELYARGFNYLSQNAAGETRATRWLNEAYIEDIAEPYPWADLETTSTSLTITDLKDVIHVLDTTNDHQLSFSDSRSLTDMDADYATTAGSAEFWYITDEGALATYPTDAAASYSVRYLKVPAELETGNDEPILPSRMHPLIVDFAVVRAYRDRDNWESADKMQAHADRRLAQFANSILWQTSDTGSISVLAGSEDW